MNLVATLELKKSAKGNEYYCIVIKIGDNYEKIVFLDKAEIELIKIMQNTNKK